MVQIPRAKNTLKKDQSTNQTNNKKNNNKPIDSRTLISIKHQLQTQQIQNK